MKKLMVLVMSLVMMMTLTVPCFAAGSTENVALKLAATVETDPTQQHHNEDEQLPDAERSTSGTPSHLSDVKRPASPEDDDGSGKPSLTPPLPIPTPQPKARFLTKSVILNTEGDEVTEVVISEIYSLVTTIRASLTGEEVVSLDARNLRVGANGYVITHGFQDTLFSGTGTPFFIVFDNESDMASGYNLIQADIVGADRAVIAYVKGSAELITSDGKTIALDDAEFLTQEGSLIGDSANDGILLAENVATVSLKFTVEEYKPLPLVNDLDGNPLPETQGMTSVSDRVTTASADSNKAQTPPVDEEPEVSPALYEDDLYSKEYFAEQRIKFIEAKANDTQKVVSWLLVAVILLALAGIILAACLVGLNNKINTLSKHIDEAKNSTFDPQEQDGEHQERPKRYGDFFTEKPDSDEAGTEGEYDAEHICKIPVEENDWLNKVLEETLGSEADDSDK